MVIKLPTASRASTGGSPRPGGLASAPRVSFRPLPCDSGGDAGLFSRSPSHSYSINPFLSDGESEAERLAPSANAFTPYAIETRGKEMKNFRKASRPAESLEREPSNQVRRLDS